MQRVLISLFKNAEEAKAERIDVGLTVESTPDGGTHLNR
jgi:hypothetical protein